MVIWVCEALEVNKTVFSLTVYSVVHGSHSDHCNAISLEQKISLNNSGTDPVAYG